MKSWGFGSAAAEAMVLSDFAPYDVSFEKDLMTSQKHWVVTLTVEEVAEAYMVEEVAM